MKREQGQGPNSSPGKRQHSLERKVEDAKAKDTGVAREITGKPGKGRIPEANERECFKMLPTGNKRKRTENVR